MSKRKLIGLITAVPESVHAKRVFEGVFSQCEKYGYDVAVFGSLVHLSEEYKEYLRGELNIYELVNFDLFDGIIVDTISLIENGDETIKNTILEKMQKECHKPVVSLCLPFGDYPMVKNSDEPILREMTEHILDVHKVTDIYFLTGPKENPVAVDRLNYFQKVMQERGFSVGPEQFSYGNFWYDSGSALAERILSGEMPMHRAVICANDYMALGLARRLMKGGVQIPEDVIVIGFEASLEAALDTVPITTFESNAVQVAAEAVNLLYSQMEQEAPMMHPVTNRGTHIHTGMSCGCKPDGEHSARAFKDSFYYIFRDCSNDEGYNNIDIGQLMEGYVAERLADAETPQECLRNIYCNTFYLCPYTNFYLCLKEDWLDINNVVIKGYPERMKIAVHSTPVPDTGFCDEAKSITFDTKKMLPQMLEGVGEPSVYYFSAVHSKDRMLGYAVLQRSMKEKRVINLVYRNWLRHVNNSLEMTQAKNRLMMLSVYDEMTGAYNRRGMDIILDKMLKVAKAGDSLLVCVIDMDGLKYINDTFGHTEGDFSIKTVCKAAFTTGRTEEICVRAGGDEFYVFGIGKYEDTDIEKRVQDFNARLEEYSNASRKPYRIEASIGIEIVPMDGRPQINNVINAADEKMYKSKAERKKQRI